MLFLPANLFTLQKLVQRLTLPLYLMMFLSAPTLLITAAALFTHYNIPSVIGKCLVLKMNILHQNKFLTLFC
ncbi:hypothetical protein GM30_05565 [Trabulsiella odontotermitis]|nr:hypothetical protein GM30_05565 [Trabulsiella odontotermitis]